MKLSLWVGVWLLAASLLSSAQTTNQVTLERRPDGWWATWSNTPPLFKISTSTNMVNWYVWMRKESGESLKSMEMKLAHTNDLKFMKFEPVSPPIYPPPPSTNLLKLMGTLTNKTGTTTK